MQLNLKTTQGRGLLTELIRTADVVIENLGPGAMDRLGLGYEALSKINPRIIMASVKGFGSEGPYASYKSFEMIAQAMSGVMSLTGAPDGPPMRVEAGLGDTGSGLAARVRPRAGARDPDAGRLRASQRGPAGGGTIFPCQ